ncbi:MAG: ABC transporter permease [Dactylosporangium sp.]|nr:ABC transporter permease [Dactylosporangium sp.]NNJ59956.1 ABC transporter permease [Dactylosporangium sp.]
MSGWRTALRVARREAGRARGRTALTTVMIALPVLALSFVSTVYTMFDLRPDEELSRTLGQADAALTYLTDHAVQQDAQGKAHSYEPSPTALGARARLAEAQTALPEGTRFTTWWSGRVRLRTASGTGVLSAHAADLTDPMTRGIASVARGRAPRGPDEIAVTAAGADRLGVGLGGTVRLADGSRGYTVVALIEIPSDLLAGVLFTPAGGPRGTGSGRETRLLVDAPGPVDRASVLRLNQRGFLVVSRELYLRPPAPDAGFESGGASPTAQIVALLAAVVVGVGILEVVLLAGPAFAIGARRRQRDLALLAASGASPAQLRRVVLADGLIAGVLASACGTVLGIAAGFASRGLFEEHLAQARAGGYRVMPLVLAATVVLAVVVGVVAAAMPAFTAARQDVVAVLAGRRPAGGIRKRWLALGLGMTAAGAASGAYGAATSTAPIMVAGLFLTEIGLVLCTPALVSALAVVGRILPLTPRIALRDAARNRAAASSAIAAVMAGVAGSVAIVLFTVSEEERGARTYSPVLPYGYVSAMGFLGEQLPDTAAVHPAIAQGVHAARSTLPAEDVIVTRGLRCPADAAGARGQGRCSLSSVLPEAQRCPYDDRDALTTAQRRAAVRDPRCSTARIWTDGHHVDVIVDDGTDLAILTGASGEDLARARATLRRGGVVVAESRYVTDGTVTLQVTGLGPAAEAGDDQAGDDQAGGTLTVPGYAMTTAAQRIVTVVSPAVVERAGLVSTPTGIVVATSQMPTRAEQDSFTAAIDTIHDGLSATAAEPAAPGTGGEARPAEEKPDVQPSVTVEDGPRTEDTAMILLILTIGAGVVTVGAAGATTGLAAADGRADLDTLAAVGASPWVRRKLSLSQSGVIAGLGTALGVTTGLGLIVMVLTALNRGYADTWPAPMPYPIVVPWRHIATIALVVPAVAGLGAGLLTRARLPIERRQ